MKSYSVTEISKKAKGASVLLANVSEEDRNDALEEMALALESNVEFIMSENKRDLEEFKKIDPAADASPLYQRLMLTDSKIRDMIAGIRDVKKLEDPIGKTLSSMELDDELMLYQISCPIGVIGVVFEARPDVVPQILALCLKSGNATIFKGGAEATNSNKALFDILTNAMKKIPEIPVEAFGLLETREEVSQLLEMDEYIDLLIPRGSNEFIKYIQDNTRIPVLGHTSGICHAYVDESYDKNITYDVCLDSKIQYPAACNAIETLLVNRKIANDFLPKMGKIYEEHNVTLLCDNDSYKILKDAKINAEKATEEDWDAEYNDMILAIKIVDSVNEAIEHINTHGSHHTDAICATDKKAIDLFTSLVDSADVMVNASTRFADGFRFGKGAEVGISTNKIHARGPVGMEGLMSYKYLIFGNGHKVSDYESGDKKYTHVSSNKKYCRLG
ncbi:MAG: glutamate-5-semialdehyde dehydrogenase [Methanosarcinaceae archaeon]|nr:glutamate-5-semialdehyde dehydrogenase [Methanosarcinaceae archaeon]